MKLIEMVVLEDDPALSGLLVSVLSKMGAKVDTAINLDQLNAILDARDKCPDVVWFDVRIPGATRDDVYNSITSVRQKCPNSVLVGLTGLSDPKVREQALAAGADAFAVKPLAITRFTFSSLIAQGAIASLERGESKNARVLDLAVRLATNLLSDHLSA